MLQHYLQNILDILKFQYSHLEHYSHIGSLNLDHLLYLVAGSEYVNKELVHLCTLMGIRHSPRTAYSPWTNGLVEVQNRNLGTHLRMFFHDTPKDWAFQVQRNAYAHNSQPLSELNVSPHEIVFHTRPRVPFTFDLNLTRNNSKTFISQYCSQLPQHSHYDRTDLNPFFIKPFLNLFHNCFSL